LKFSNPTTAVDRRRSSQRSPGRCERAAVRAFNLDIKLAGLREHAASRRELSRAALGPDG